MNKSVHQQLRTSVVKTACSLYAVRAQEAIRLPSFQNGVFLLPSCHGPFVLRFSHHPRRTETQLLAELDWMAFLGEHGIRVPASFPSVRGNLVEEIPVAGGARFLVCALEHLRGRSLGRTVLTHQMVAKWGQLVGTIHRLSARYSPSKKNLCRPVWHLEDNYAIDAFAPRDPILRTTLKKQVNELLALPRHPLAYGLIHGDIQPDNLLMTNFGLGIIDFDGAVYSWYMHEIAIALFSVLPLNQSLQSRTEFASKFLLFFFEGYSKELEPNLTLLDYLDAFLKLEEMGEYLLALRSRQPQRLLAGTGRTSINEWTLALRNREPLVLPLGMDLRPSLRS